MQTVTFLDGHVLTAYTNFVSLFVYSFPTTTHYILVYKSYEMPKKKVIKSILFCKEIKIPALCRTGVLGRSLFETGALG